MLFLFELWASARGMAAWAALFLSGLMSCHLGWPVCGSLLLGMSGYAAFHRGFGLGRSHERRLLAITAKELDVDLEDEPVPAETSDGHPLH